MPLGAMSFSQGSYVLVEYQNLFVIGRWEAKLFGANTE